ncbi:MAG: hypothetical protein IJZ72_04055 [Oscillospiraceae bacterium]|nr:hypothetical protein [Oscillospiraceae bacterium]
MLNFDTKRRILKKLTECSKKNALLFLPCVIAIAFVKLFYNVGCSIDMAFSDRNGNFLGIKGSEKKAKTKKQDDIVFVKRSAFSRFISGVLAASFIIMAVPAVSITSEADVYDREGFEQEPNDGYWYKTSENSLIAPVIIPEACVVGDGAYKLSWEDPGGMNGLKTEVEKFTISFTSDTEIGTEERIIEIKDINETGSYDYIITGLSPDRNYNFVVTAHKTIQYYYWVENPVVDGNIGLSRLMPVPYNKNGTHLKKVTAKSDVHTDIPYDYIHCAPQFTVTYYEEGQPAEGNPERVEIKMLPYEHANEVTGYVIYRRNEDDKTPVEKIVGQYTNYEELLNGITLYNDPKAGYPHGMEDTTNYSYRIMAYNNVFGVKEYMNFYNEKEPWMYTKSINDSSVSMHTKTGIPNITEAETDEVSITITWERVKSSAVNAHADGYYVYRYTKAEYDDAGGRPTLDTAHRLDSVPDSGTSKLSFTDTKADNKIMYYYFVTAYRYYGDQSNDNESDPDEIHAELNTGVTKPISLHTIPEDGMITLEWTATDKNVKGYDIRITKITDKDGNDLADENGVYNEVMIVEDWAKSPYDHTGLLNGEKYRYEVRAYKIINGVKEPISGWSEPVEEIVGVYFYSPEDIDAEPGDGTVLVTWSPVDRAEQYIISIFKHNADGTITPVGERTIAAPTTEYLHKNLYNGDKYSYYVIARKFVSNEEVDSEPSDTITATVGIPLMAPTDLTAKVSEEKVDLSWSSVKGAEGYYLYIVDENGNTEYVEVSKNKYTHYAEHGKKYTYYVKPYKYIKTKDGTQKYFGPESESIAVIAGIALDAPTDLAAEVEDGQIELSWSKVNGAEGYIVYAMVDGITTTYQVTKTKFVHTGVINGKTYSYFVKAYKDVNNERIYSAPSLTVSAVAGEFLAAPKDFYVETEDANAILTWSKVSGAEGYTVYAYTDGESLEFDVSKNKFTHTGLQNGSVWHYYVKAFKTVNGTRVYGAATHTVDVTIGASLNAPVDLIATAGDRQIDLSWTKVNNAEGYVIYLYNESSESFVPLTVVSKTKYSHVGLKNGTKYTYMVAAFRTINGERVYGAYSMAVSAIPSKGSTADLDATLNVKGTAPYGISHSELISAVANHEAFDESVDIYFSVNEESTNAVKNVLKHFANGLSSFIIYPFDISTYIEGTLIAIDPNPGFSVTITMPIPDKLVKYRDYITVVHIDTHGSNVIDEDSDEIFTDSADLEVLPSAVMLINNVWCIQFAATNFSPFAFVIYKDNLMDVSSGAAAEGGTSAGSFNTDTLQYTALPDIMPTEKKYKFVVSRKKYYRIKK